MKTFPLEIYALDKISYCGECERLTVPAVDGELGIMADREPVVAALAAGELRYTVNGETTVLAVGDGFVEVTEKEVYILVDFAERADEIDRIRAEAAAKRARDRLAIKKDARDVAHAQAALSRALARLAVSTHHGGH